MCFIAYEHLNVKLKEKIKTEIYFLGYFPREDSQKGKIKMFQRAVSVRSETWANFRVH